MNKNIEKVALIAGLLMAASVSFASPSACDAQSGNLVANCGFETGDFTGWTVSGNDVPFAEDNLYGVEQGADPFDLILPNSGNYQVFIGDQTSNATTLSQTLSTTAGDNYLVSFFLAQDTVAGTGAYGNSLTAMFGGTTLTNMSNMSVQGYTEYSFLTAAGSDSTTLSLTLGNGLGEFLLDDVSVSDASVNAVPEPGTIAAVAIGLLAMMLALGRRSTFRN